MGYLDNSSITVDAILTKKGRDILATGRGNFKITQFALADDEVDYDLWNPNDPRGTAYNGSIIESLPLTEALPDETQVMKYKLITLPATATSIPQLTATPLSFAFFDNDAPKPLVPSVSQFPSANATLGYTVIVSDASLATVTVTVTPPVGPGTGSAAQFLGDAYSTLYSAQSQAYVGLEFNVQGKAPAGALVGTSYSTTLTVIGNETGGRLTIPIRITVPQSSNLPGGGLS